MRHIFGKYVTNNYLIMRFKFLLRIDSPNPFRMSWRIIKRNIVTWIMNIGVTFCPPSR